MQRLELVDDRFPALLSGEKRSTIRWREGAIVPGLLEYYSAHDQALRVTVLVTACRTMSLRETALAEGVDPQRQLAAMRRHYPEITLETKVSFIEHLTPQETAAARRG